MSQHLPMIVIEVVLVFGGALAFAWWQFRDLRREREKREARERLERQQATGGHDAP
ncbi:MAG: hypothetical protein U1F56_24790 [Rubrivivax sp.]